MQYMLSFMKEKLKSLPSETMLNASDPTGTHGMPIWVRCTGRHRRQRRCALAILGGNDGPARWRQAPSTGWTVAVTKEQLAGYVVIEVPDLDAALSWAARSPGKHIRGC